MRVAAEIIFKNFDEKTQKSLFLGVRKKGFFGPLWGPFPLDKKALFSTNNDNTQQGVLPGIGVQRNTSFAMLRSETGVSLYK